MSLQLMLHILQLSPCCMKMRSVLCLAEDTAHEALEVLHTRLKAPERSFQDRGGSSGASLPCCHGTCPGSISAPRSLMHTMP